MTNQRFTGLLFALVISSACGHAQVRPLQRSDDALIVLPGVLNVRQPSDNRDALVYELQEPYPATNAIDTLKSAFEKKGWQPLTEDVLNPGTKSSLVTGWTQYEDATKHPSRWVFQWSVQWKDTTGKVVWCLLNYDGQERQGDITPTGSLKITEMIMPHRQP